MGSIPRDVFDAIWEGIDNYAVAVAATYVVTKDIAPREADHQLAAKCIMAFTCFKRQQTLTRATNQLSGVFFLTKDPLLVHVVLYSFRAQISSRAPNMTEIMMLAR